MPPPSQITEIRPPPPELNSPVEAARILDAFGLAPGFLATIKEEMAKLEAKKQEAENNGARTFRQWKPTNEVVIAATTISLSRTANTANELPFLLDEAWNKSDQPRPFELEQQTRAFLKGFGLEVIRQAIENKDYDFGVETLGLATEGLIFENNDIKQNLWKIAENSPMPPAFVKAKMVEAVIRYYQTSNRPSLGGARTSQQSRGELPSDNLPKIAQEPVAV